MTSPELLARLEESLALSLAAAQAADAAFDPLGLLNEENADAQKVAAAASAAYMSLQQAVLTIRARL